MSSPETPRDAAVQRILDQETRIAQQKVLIARLRANGAATGIAEGALATMESSLDALRTSLSHYRS